MLSAKLMTGAVAVLADAVSQLSHLSDEMFARHRVKIAVHFGSPRGVYMPSMANLLSVNHHHDSRQSFDDRTFPGRARPDTRRFLLIRGPLPAYRLIRSRRQTRPGGGMESPASQALKPSASHRLKAGRLALLSG